MDQVLGRYDIDDCNHHKNRRTGDLHCRSPLRFQYDVQRPRGRG